MTECPVFHELESFSFPSASPPHLISSTCPPSFLADLYEDGLPMIISPHISSEIAEPLTLPPRAILCPSCKGKKYGFTAYFHNTKIFSEPPHEILSVVEESYILRDNLKSLWVTYAMRELGEDEFEGTRAQIARWQFRVGILIDEVVALACNAGFSLNPDGIEEVRKWKDTVADELRYYVSEKLKTQMPSGRLAVLMLEYRKVWEAVWIGYLQDRKAAPSDSYVISYPVIM